MSATTESAQANIVHFRERIRLPGQRRSLIQAKAMRPAIPTPCANAKKKAAVTIWISRRLVRKMRTWVEKVYWNDTIAAPAISTGQRAETLASILISSRKLGGALGVPLAA